MIWWIELEQLSDLVELSGVGSLGVGDDREAEDAGVKLVHSFLLPPRSTGRRGVVCLITGHCCVVSVGL